MKLPNPLIGVAAKPALAASDNPPHIGPAQRATLDRVTQHQTLENGLPWTCLLAENMNSVAQADFLARA